MWAGRALGQNQPFLGRNMKNVYLIELEYLVLCSFVSV